MKAPTVPSSGSQAEPLRRAIALANTCAHGLFRDPLPRLKVRCAGACRSTRPRGAASTAGQRAGWADLGLSIVRSDSLGQLYNLQGDQVYASVNNIRVQCGLTPVADAPTHRYPGARRRP
jgi:hypothetical protein